MIRKESYGFNTFAGLRVGEIQSKTSYDAWKHIPSSENIADVLTRGALPSVLGPESVWQKGPEWLTLEEEEWPVSNSDLSKDEKDMIKNFEKIGKAKYIQTFKAGSSLSSTSVPKPFNLDIHPDEINQIDLLMTRCSSLKKLIRITSYLLRLVGRLPKYTF